jgi:hypothetical protein
LDNDLSRFDGFLSNAKARKEPKRHAKEVIKEYLEHRGRDTAPAKPTEAVKAKQPKQPIGDFIK